MAAPYSPLTVLRSAIVSSKSQLRAPPSVQLLSFMSKQVRWAMTTKKKAPRKKKSPNYRLYDLKKAEQFALCDAMRYIHAFEVGRDPASPKYELAIRLRTSRDGAVIRSNFKLPHPVKSMKVCVICPPGSGAEAEAKSAGASLVGEEAVIEAVKAGNLDFERCICHPDSLEKVTKSGIARILGPRGLMPSLKMNTVRKDVKVALKTMVEGSGYRERSGVLRLAVGQLAFTPEQLKTNIQAVIAQIKRDAADLSDRINKEIHEIVLSSTNSPGFSLNGEFRTASSLQSKELVM